VLAAMVAGVVFFVILYSVIWQFFWWQRASQEALHKSPSPGVTERLPAEPRLEQLDRLSDIPGANVAQREKAHLDTLRSLGPAEEKGFAHVPIWAAIESVAGKLPVRSRTPPEQAKDRGLLDAGAPNSGRLFTEERK
jgi:hypothetical protein